MFLVIVGTQVGRALARDRDLPPNNEFTYFLDRRYNTFRLFDLDQVTGVISTREVLDRERQSMYNLVVVARSKNKPKSTATAYVQIEVNHPVVVVVDCVVVVVVVVCIDDYNVQNGE